METDLEKVEKVKNWPTQEAFISPPILAYPDFQQSLSCIPMHQARVFGQYCTRHKMDKKE